jgi:hypothetical protein
VERRLGSVGTAGDVARGAAAGPLGLGVNVALRELWRGRVWRVSALRLVDRQAGAFVLWHPEAASVKRPHADGLELRIPSDTPWTLVDAPAPNEGLGFLRPGARHSLWLHFRDGAFVGWYVNFERESVRHGPFFDLVDEKLDLVVARDGAVRVKDEDELEQAARAGYLDEADVRAELARVLADPPWPTGWEGWRPDPAWPQPQLPPGWEAP